MSGLLLLIGPCTASGEPDLPCATSLGFVNGKGDVGTGGRETRLADVNDEVWLDELEDEVVTNVVDKMLEV